MKWPSNAILYITRPFLHRPTREYPSSAAWHDAYALLLNAVFFKKSPKPERIDARCTRVYNAKHKRLGEQFSVKEWAWVTEVTVGAFPEGFRRQPRIPILVLQVRPPEALECPEERAKADQVMREAMWRSAKKCPDYELNGICAFGTRVAFYSLDPRVPNADVIPARTADEPVPPSNRWGFDLLSDSGRTRFNDVTYKIASEPPAHGQGVSHRTPLGAAGKSIIMGACLALVLSLSKLYWVSDSQS
ncbi:hypothetical protein P691DRAFT_778000 [Macrolepiota fuliginosa MF-IS2]|uniref:Uncharacterized protein n=1 Tax=Macrolepiota fuliginosa MF-IS2 TaxID=1400762 RepID=A0A9P5X6X9_9AGAR|nr:hypothetical protein P691DRAFT_778000 [Macrolepiota fuliginosa MF-IS2]